MGTPGDKTGGIEEVVVKTEPEPIRHRPRTPLYTAQQGFPLEQTPTVREQPSTSEMGVIERVPVQFPSNPIVQRTGAKPDSFQDIQLEQSKIERYYVQTKYYPDYQQPSTSKSLEQPGPSGLQTPAKSKPAAYASTPGRLKKSRKESHQSRKSHQCPYCKKCFASSDKLDKHGQTHTGSSPFKCDNCKKIFTSKFKLVRHALIHSDRKPFSCTVCDRTFHRKDHLKNHVKVHSPQKDVYVCDNCKKQYTSLLSYRKHLALHAAEEGNLTCQICQLVFESKEKILFHLKIHAGSRTVKNPNEKKFKCDECGRRFFTRKDVRRHNVVHTGMRDFLCQYCPQRFGRKDHLVRHIKKSHNNKYKAEESAGVSIKIEPKETPETAIKTEYVAPAIISSVDLGLPLIEGDLTPFLESENLLASSTTDELKYLSSSILDIESTSTPPGILIAENVDASQVVLDDNEVLLSNPELLLLEAPEETNLPLPGFSQTFQSPPGPQQ
ncbi:unnamed protein product [Phyllotreta striolata]|uniref:C2H2-type domain-containing protein n=1 Tax=Phyllotreta striolata TaxID=444603 RepID=A0A9N9XM85_PHYSR|nr:unnamed protein product [Phyllotreta striolata]